MKKMFLFVSVAIILSLLLVGCSGGLSKHKRQVSEYRDDVLVGKGERFSAVACTGYRENPFEIDGKSGEKCDFCLVTVKPVDFDPTAAYDYKVQLDGAEYEGELVKHPFESSYSFELPVRSGSTLTVIVDGEKIELSSVKTEEFIEAEKAFEIAYKRLSHNKIVESGKYEVYIRLIENPVSASGGYFWYVAFVDESKETCAVLIHPENMDIIAVRD